MSGAACRRIYLDQEIDGRVDRVRCEDKEERCDVCQESNTIIEKLEAQRQADQVEQDKQDPRVDSGIVIPSSSIVLPSSPPRVFHHQISPEERFEFQSQQSQR